MPHCVLAATTHQWSNLAPIELPYPLPSVSQRSVDNESSQRDPVSEALIGVRFLGARSVAVEPYGNCLPRTASYISNDTESLHVEMKVRTVHELIAHGALYLDDAFLSRGLATEDTRNDALRYAQYSPWYVPGATLTDSDIDQLYRKEVADVIRPGAFCGMWHLHAVASIFGTRIDSLYPGQGVPEQDLNIVLIPRESATGDVANAPSYPLDEHYKQQRCRLVGAEPLRPVYPKEQHLQVHASNVIM